MDDVKVVAKYSPDGRITIPKEFRTALGLDKVGEFEISLVGRSLLVTPVRNRCHICGKSIGEENYTEVNGVKICRDCDKAFKSHYKGGV